MRSNIKLMFLFLGLLLTSSSCNKIDCACSPNDGVISTNITLHDSLYYHSNSLSDYLFGDYNLAYLNRFDNPHYRLFFNSLLDENYYAFSIEEKSDSFIYKEQLFNENGRLMIDVDRLLNSNEVEELRELIYESCVYNIPLDIPDDDNYLDGSIWILELSKVDNCRNLDYIVAIRNSPGESDFLKVAGYLYSLSKLKGK